MNKIEEIAIECINIHYKKGFPYTIDGFFEDLEKAMTEYAEYYAQKCLEIAAKNAVALERDYNDDWYVDKNSILNIELPSHD
jgi:hypothetical protein